MLFRTEWRAAIDAAAAAATRQLDELKQKMAADAAAAPGHDKALLQQAQDAAATLVKQQVGNSVLKVAANKRYPIDPSRRADMLHQKLTPCSCRHCRFQQTVQDIIKL